MRLRPHTLGLGGGREDPRRREPEVMFGVWGGGRRGRWSCWTLSEKPVACSLPSFLNGPLKAWLRMRKTCGVEDVQHWSPWGR